MLLVLQLKVLFTILGIKKPILWIENLAAAEIPAKLKPVCVLYYCSDKFDASRHLKARDALRMQDAMLTEQSDGIICVSRMLFRSKKRDTGIVEIFKAKL